MNAPAIVIASCLAFVTTLAGTGIVRRLALRHNIIDRPNPRSSHLRPTPRGGGVAVVVVVLAVAIGLLSWGLLSDAEFAALAVGGLAVAGVGFIDDRRSLSAATRIGVHFMAAGCAVLLIANSAPPLFGGTGVGGDWYVSIICVFAVVWMLNLFNFMDGIDGIAAAEAVFICASGALLLAMTGATDGLVILLSSTAAAIAGFLYWNVAPAKIFMGDAGSGFIGYAIAALALIASSRSSVPIWTWLILSSLFVADATVTLARRMWRREKWYSAHRTHAYQWLSRRWSSHGKVTGLYSLTNIVLVLPIACASVVLPEHASLLAFGSLILAGAGALLCGAGRREI